MMVQQQFYRVPKQYLRGDGNAAYLLFWDSLYYLLATAPHCCKGEGRRIENLNNRTLTHITGIADRTLSKIRAEQTKEQDKNYHLIEEEGDEKYSFNYTLPHYNTIIQKEIYTRPIQLHTHGWLKYIYTIHKSRYPLAILNAFLALPEGRRVQSFSRLRDHITKKKKAPEPQEIRNALATLERLQLLIPLADDQYKLNQETLLHRTPEEQPHADPTPTHLAQRYNISLPLASQLLQLAQAGKIDLDLHSTGMIRDLGYLRTPYEYGLLVATATQRQGENTPQTQRWPMIWRTFCEQRERQSYTVRSPQHRLSFAQTTTHQLTLTLPPPRSAHPPRWVKLIVATEDPTERLSQGEGISTTLQIGQQIVWKRRVEAETPLLRPDLTAYWHTPFSCQLHLHAPDNAPHLHLSCHLEGCYYRGEETELSRNETGRTTDV